MSTIYPHSKYYINKKTKMPLLSSLSKEKCLRKRIASYKCWRYLDSNNSAEDADFSWPSCNKVQRTCIKMK